MRKGKFRSVFCFFEFDNEKRVRTVVRKFRGAPFLDDLFILHHLSGGAGNIALPGGKLSADLGGDFGRGAGKGGMLLAAEPGGDEGGRGDGEDGANGEGVFHDKILGNCL